MKKQFILACFLIAGYTVAAQAPPRQRDNLSPTEGRMFGKLVDSAGKGIGNGAVSILQHLFDSATGKPKDILLQGGATQNNGDFSIEGLPVNKQLKISISVVGYKPFTQITSIKPPSFEKDMGIIPMAAVAKELREVVVVATKPAITLDMDKKIFNVSRDIVSTGGTGIDVLKNVPGINVDFDGNISLRGSSPQLMIDGKPTILTLDVIPSDAIESVEVITNPSAKYDAAGGGAGILNIVLKKNRKAGYNGSVRAGADSYGQTSLGAEFNVRENKINFSAGINTRLERDRMTGATSRNNLGDTPQTLINQQNLDTTTGGKIFGRLGLDYFISNRTTISLTGFISHRTSTNSSNLTIITDSLYSTGKIPQYSLQEINSTSTTNGWGLTTGIKHLFTKPKEELTADISYFSGNAVNNSLYTTDRYAAAAGSPLASSEWQKILGNSSDNRIIFQTDYTTPLISITTLDIGARASLEKKLSINNNYTYNNDSAAYILIPSAASNYKSSYNVYAAYAMMSSSIKNFSYKLGLRAESSNYQGTLLNTGHAFSNQFPLSLFPSVFVSQKLKSGEELQLSYTRRVNRPGLFQLIPFTDSSNRLNITRGNPDLLPEFTQSLELTYLKALKGNNIFMGSIYYKHTDQVITNYIEQETNATSGNTLINTFINANSSNSFGTELTAQNTLTSWWDISTNINIYHSKINIGITGVPPQASLWSWFGKINTNVKLPLNFTIQASAMYQSKTSLPVNNNQHQPGAPNIQSSQNASQGYIKAFYEVNLGVRKTLLNNKMALSLSFNDIFRSRQQNQYSYSSYFIQEDSRLRNPQVLRLNFTYNFGKVDASLFKRRNNSVSNIEE